jgi:hypothetical protein
LTAPALCLALAAVAAEHPAIAGSAAQAPEPVQVLEPVKGRQALAAYRRFFDQVCDGLWTTADGRPMRPSWNPANHDVERSPARHAGDPAAKLEQLGLGGLDELQVCTNLKEVGQPLASGAFLQAGADEVLLQVFLGFGGTGGAYTLAVMRAAGPRYRFVRHILTGSRFEPRMRLALPGHPDVLFLCDLGGHMGDYRGHCGFLGHGSFAYPTRPPPLATIAGAAAIPPADPALADELDLIQHMACGPSSSVELGKVAARDGLITVELVVEESVRSPGPEESQDFCTLKTSASKSTFPIEYRYDGKRFRRLAPVPAKVRQIVER